MKKTSLLIAPAIGLAALLSTAVTYYNGIVTEYEVQHSRLTNLLPGYRTS